MFEDFSGGYHIHFGWPDTSSRQPLSRRHRLQTSVTFYWFWRLAASVCSDKEQKKKKRERKNKKCVCECVTVHICSESRREIAREGEKFISWTVFDLVIWGFY